LPPPHAADCAAKVTDVCTLYRDAPTVAQQGERVVSTDELTGMHALERTHPGLPMAAGQVERREFADSRPGTGTFLLRRDVVTGQGLAPSAGPTRTEADFLAHGQGAVASRQARAAFLGDPCHRGGCHDPPTHGSWRNPIEIWRSILVRKLLQRGSFSSVEHRKARVLAFIAYANRTMAKPCKWTSQGKPLLT
jgi:putative transposase